MIDHQMDLLEILFSEGSDGLSDLTFPVKREEDFAVLWPFFWVRKQVDEKRNVTRCTPFQLLEHFQEDRSLRLLKNYVPKPDALLKIFDGVLSPVKAPGDLFGQVKIG